MGLSSFITKIRGVLTNFDYYILCGPQRESKNIEIYIISENIHKRVISTSLMK